MFSTLPFSSRPFAAGPLFESATIGDLGEAESGWAAWSYSKTAKLNAWSWHSLGTTGTNKAYAWATIGNSIYLRRDDDTNLYVLRPDVFFDASDTNGESLKVYAETQWLDFGKPGNLKALTGLDFDGLNVVSVLVKVSVDGDREGTIADTILVGTDQDGWTYSGGILPVNAASTEFKLRFVGSPNLEVQINRLTIYWEDFGADVINVTFLTTPDLISLHWWSVAKLVNPVVNQAGRGEFTTEDLAALVDTGRAFAGLAFDGQEPLLGMVFEFRQYPARLVVNVIALGGSDLARVAVMFWPQFVAWVKEAGASGIEASTSPAMTRALRGLGMVHTYDLVRLDFAGEKK